MGYIRSNKIILLFLSTLLCIATSCSQLSSNMKEGDRKVASEKGNDTGNKIGEIALRNLSRKELKDKWAEYSSISDDGNLLTQVSLVEEGNANGILAAIVDSQAIYRIAIHKRDISGKDLGLELYSCEPDKKALKDAKAIERDINSEVITSFFCNQVRPTGLYSVEKMRGKETYFSMFKDKDGATIFAQHNNGYVRQIADKFTFRTTIFGDHSEPELKKFWPHGD